MVVPKYNYRSAGYYADHGYPYISTKTGFPDDACDKMKQTFEDWGSDDSGYLFWNWATGEEVSNWLHDVAVRDKLRKMPQPYRDYKPAFEPESLYNDTLSREPNYLLLEKGIEKIQKQPGFRDLERTRVYFCISG